MPTEKQIQKLLEERYYLPTENTWDKLAERVSFVAREEDRQAAKQLITNREFIPSSPTLMNANTNGVRRGTLSSCFPITIKDSMTDIMETMNDVAKITQYGGGVGLSFDRLRGSNEFVSGNGRKSGGPLSFIGIYDAILDGVMQGGARRGAGMSQMSVYHPDILKFIKAKQNDRSKYTRSNFSVRIPNRFYDILETAPDTIFKTINVVDKQENDLIGDNGEVYTYQKLWDEIIYAAWLSAEPGIFNSDIAYDQCTVTNLDDEVLSNPCQEFTNIPYASCNLGSIDLAKMLTPVDGVLFTDNDKYVSAIHTALKFLNSVIDKNDYPIEKISNITMKIRPVGLGFMGLAHALMKLEIPYASEAGKNAVKYFIKTLTLEAMKESIELAKVYGAYEAFDYDLFVKANTRLFKYEEFANLLPSIKKYGIRNSGLTSLAPTGSVSYIANTSSGIEPVFALSYIRRIEHTNKEFEEVFITDDVFEQFLDAKYPNEKKEILKEVTSNNGSCQKSKYLTATEKAVFKVAADLTPQEHLDVLAIVSEFTSYSVSKCIHKDSIIRTEKGLRFIHQLSDNRTEDSFEPITEIIFNKDGVKETASQFYYNGVKPCKKILLSNGIIFEATYTHRILDNDNNWVEMQNVKKGTVLK